MQSATSGASSSLSSRRVASIFAFGRPHPVVDLCMRKQIPGRLDSGSAGGPTLLGEQMTSTEVRPHQVHARSFSKAALVAEVLVTGRLCQHPLGSSHAPLTPRSTLLILALARCN